MDELTKDNIPDQEEKWPGVMFAYDFVKPSYDWMASRMEAAVTRTQAFLTIATTITLGFPVLGAALNKTINFHSTWFIAAIASYFALVALGIMARHTGDLILISPSKLYENCTCMSEWAFKRHALYYAGKDFDENTAVINRKMRLGTWMSGLLVIEAASFVMWIAWQPY